MRYSALALAWNAVTGQKSWTPAWRDAAPHEDTWPYVRALVDAFSLEHCLWASDWPYLRAPSRVDYGVQLEFTQALFPDAGERRVLLWETPRHLFGFG